jgi:lipid A 3-O-deacylase
MRSFLLIALLFIMLCPAPTRANDNFMQMDGMTFTGGMYGHNTDRRGWRIAPRWDWGVEWLKQSPIRVTGYWEAGLGNWQAFEHHVGGNDSLWIVSGSEIFQFWLGPVNKTRNALFLEFGIGPGYLTSDELGSRDFGGHWQFEDKFGAGVNFGTTRPLQLIYRYYHYSNAGFQPPNNGLDLHTLAFVCFF